LEASLRVGADNALSSGGKERTQRDMVLRYTRRQAWETQVRRCATTTRNHHQRNREDHDRHHFPIT